MVQLKCWLFIQRLLNQNLNKPSKIVNLLNDIKGLLTLLKIKLVRVIHIFKIISGMCELVMVGEDFPKTLSNKFKNDVMAPKEESDDEDDEIDQSESFDIQMDSEFGMHRSRSNTAQRLEKLELAQKRAAKVKHIKWEKHPVPISEEEKNSLFAKRDYKHLKANTTSLLTQQLKCYTNLPQNPYLEYAKFDGNAQVGIPIRKYRIYLTILPEEQRNYPMNVCVIATAKVQDLIGLICLKCRSV